MNIIFFGNGGRSLPCLEVLKELGHHIQVIVSHPENESKWYTSLAKSAVEMKIPIYSPDRPNSKSFEKQIKTRNFDSVTSKFTEHSVPTVFFWSKYFLRKKVK